eukprot:CAMPEP_0183739408 /NCGR_PEP_ID=MMETSP0737-20130205/56954_1 /TAXON_ID=385413 /ORGANISM="Thalassiosira miniscula, Strain CCMP1093" /LENGTH=838 /DNA_ID=CAMNT_0025974201 /DNA_START=21 /DNA_END=2535 /DNA_ORIENTATION=+
MSISALQNDIGTVLARSNRVTEAIKRYQLSIASATTVLDELQKNQNSQKEQENEEEEQRSLSVDRFKKCPKVTEAEGLAWFRQKLLRGDVLSTPIPSIDDTTKPTPEDGGGTTETSSGDSSRALEVKAPPPFQPAGFGGCALTSPRKIRSASFSVADLCPPSKTLPLHSPEDAPKTPIRQPPKLLTRMTSYPASAPYQGRQSISIIQQPHDSTPHRHHLPSWRHNNTHVVGNTSFPRRHSDHRHVAPLGDIVHDIHQHQKLDCPDEVYSCNGLTPLGLEYICDPWPVLGSPMRRLAMSSSMETADHDDHYRAKINGTSNEEKGMNVTKGNANTALILMESASLIAARLNLAGLEYRIAGGGISDKLDHVLQVLELASVDCDAAFQVIDNLSGGCRHTNATRKKFFTIFYLLKAAVHSNIGTVKFRLKKVRESMASFEEAMAALEDNEGVALSVGSCVDFAPPEHHDDSRFPPHSYLLLVVRLNLSRVSLKMKKLEDAARFCNVIAEDNKRYKRNSSLRTTSSLLQGNNPYRGFHRSNSFSAASSALETAIAAYEHDIDRRSKWLCSVAEHYIAGLILEAKDTSSGYKDAWHHYNRLLSLARTKLDHRHAYICALLERRGAVLFEQRKLPCSMLSYLACLKILEHQQSTGSNVFNEADFSRILYAIARVLHDKEEYHDALHMYQRALHWQRTLTAKSGKPASLEIITTLCNISRVHHLSGEIDAALAANREVMELATILLGGKMEHPFLIHRLKVEGNILVEVGRLEDAMRSFVEAARRCDTDDGRDRMVAAMMGGGGASAASNSQEDAIAGDSSVLSIRSASALAQINFFHPGAAAAW